MTQRYPGLRDTVTPEVVALVLVVILGLVAAALFVVLSGSAGAASPPGAGPTSPAAAGRSDAPSTTPSGGPRELLRPLVAINDELLGGRADLQLELGQATLDANAVEITVQDLAATATAAVQTADQIIAAGGGSVAEDLHGRYMDILNAANETLHASTSDPIAYKAGAAAVSGLLDQLALDVVALGDQLPPGSASLPATPPPSASPQASGSAQGSAAPLVSAPPATPVPSQP